VSDEFFVRDVSGKEIAIYSGTNIVQWAMEQKEQTKAKKHYEDKELFNNFHCSNIHTNCNCDGILLH
jgi:hypothetical protein